MSTNKFAIICVLLLSSSLIGCDDNDDSYIPVNIETNIDVIEVSKNEDIRIDVLANDINVPNNGFLNVLNPQNGSAQIVDPNATIANPLDDAILYTPNTDFVGSDSFQYTICDRNNNCETGNVNITVIDTSPVNFNLDNTPFETLSEYNFYEGDMKDLNPVYGVLPYGLNSSLFTDYAIKKRFVWMPNGAKANYNSDFTTLDFPIGSVLIKNFYYNNVLPNNSTKIIETRLLYLTSQGWDFAEYVWNDEQTEATFTTSGSYTNINWLQEGISKNVRYRIPSRNECFVCHNDSGTAGPIGPKPQNLNGNLNYVDGIANQLQKWIDVGYLENNLPESIVSTVQWDDESLDLNLRLRSYLDINCAHCHSDQRHCEYTSMRFAFKDNEDDTNKGVCVNADSQIAGKSSLVEPGNVAASILRYRVSTTEAQYRMPFLGRTLEHEEGIQLIDEWINALEGECQ